ncbi:MAG TPA: lytic transglycosylase domain-containing protein [Gaiellaceae bacterium]|nr:lytic transglycosylase domain-containing protein [Gaiellaceae bacterium]
MGLRLAVLLGVGGLACFGAVVSSAHGSRPPLAAAHIPALPARDPLVTGRCPIPSRFRDAFVHAARDTGLQLSMLVAVAQVESRFDPAAVSSADARGLLQVMPTTASSLALDPDRPASNVLAGARYLRLMLDRFQRTDLALAAYNAGPTLVDRLGRAPSQQTQTYVANVQQRWAALAGCN